MKLRLPCLLVALVFSVGAACASPVQFPLRVSDDQRTLIDASGQHFFMHGEAAWLVTKQATLQQAAEYMDLRASQGFNTLLLHTVSKEVTPPQNVAGELPFDPIDDILKPNERYWSHLDAVVEMAEKKGFLVGFAALWLRWGGTDKHGWRYQLTEQNARAYGEFLGQRFAARKNILWILCGDSEPNDRAKALDLMAEGLRAKAPHHLLTLHGGPEHDVTPALRPQPWIQVESLYSYRETSHLAAAKWWAAGEKGPAKPMFLIESGYEKESNDNRGGSAARMRRQYYGVVLNGALAGHAYGHREIWKFSPQWRRASDDDGSRTMQHAVELFRSLEWWRLRPDLVRGTFEWWKDPQQGRLVASTRGVPGEENFISAAIADRGDFAVLYIPQPRSIALDLSALKAPQGIDGTWFDPTSGERRPITFNVDQSAHVQVVRPPLKNFDGDADWVLVLKAK